MTQATIQNGWKQTTLGEVATYVTKKANINEIDINNYISTENILADRLGITKASSLPAVSKVNAFKKDDILFSNIRTYFKKVWHAKFHGGASNDVLIFRPIDENDLDKKFLYYLISSDKFINFTVITSKGTKMPRGDKDAIKGFSISLPSLPEQKAIAHILGSLDDKIELNRRMNETLEAMAQALFKSWFVDFDPVIDNALATGNAIPDELKERAAIRQGLSDEKKSLPDDIRRLFPSEFTYAEEMGWIPKGWEVGPLRLIATYCSDRIPTSELTLENYVSTENILAEKKGICTAAKLPTVKTTSSYQSGNVLVSNIRPYFKKIWFAEGSGGCSNDILNFTVKELNTEEYLLNLLWQDTFFDYMMTTAKGSKMPRGDKDAIMNWKIVIPPVESRQLFAETVRGFYEQISENYKINTVLTQLSDKLLTRLLSGEIRIKQSEQTLGDRS